MPSTTPVVVTVKVTVLPSSTVERSGATDQVLGTVIDVSSMVMVGLLTYLNDVPSSVYRARVKNSGPSVSLSWLISIGITAVLLVTVTAVAYTDVRMVGFQPTMSALGLNPGDRGVINPQ